jgi:uncharacterized lipoprotein YajG
MLYGTTAFHARCHHLKRKNQMKKFLLFTMLANVMFSGCSSEEPKTPPTEKTTPPAIQAATDKAHEVIDKTATLSQTVAGKAAEIKEIALKAADDIHATIQKSSEQVTEKETESQEAPAAAEPHK